MWEEQTIDCSKDSLDDHDKDTLVRFLWIWLKFFLNFFCLKASVSSDLSENCSLSASAKAPKRLKKLRFDKTVKVTLIPTITEYKDAGLDLMIWCSNYELQYYRDSAYMEIQKFMELTKCTDLNIAMKYLCQTGCIQTDQQEPNA